MSIESFVLSVIEDRKTVWGVKPLLWLLSKLYQLGVAIRNLCYDVGLCKMYQVPSYVVSVGNIVAGGTGKTPLIQYLAEEFSSQQRVGIVTRGYRSKIEKSGQSIEISSGQGPLVRVEECGDEPYWLSLHTKAFIWVGRDKVNSALLAAEKGIEVLLVDDGFQHRRLVKDTQIVVIDGKDPLGHGYFLPRGLLRDSPKRLKEADVIVINHTEDHEEFVKVQALLASYTKAPMVRTEPIYRFDEKWKKEKVGVFCGIAKPARFIAALKSFGCEIVEELVCLDHRVPSQNELETFAKRCQKQGAKVLVCTEKDWVKIKQTYPPMPLPIAVLSQSLKIVEAQQSLLQWIEKPRKNLE